MILVLSAVAMGVPPAGDGWELVRQDERCVYERGPGMGLPAVRARCAWPGVDAEDVDALLSDFGGHDGVWDSVSWSEIRGEAGEWTQVRHVHAVPGMANREMLLEWRRVELDQGVRIEWQMAEQQPAVARGHINTGDNQGYYWLQPTPEGIVLEACFTYDPGGLLPEVLVRHTQALTAAAMMEELLGALE